MRKNKLSTNINFGSKYHKWSFNYCKSFKVVTQFYLVSSNPLNYLSSSILAIPLKRSVNNWRKLSSPAIFIFFGELWRTNPNNIRIPNPNPLKMIMMTKKNPNTRSSMSLLTRNRLSKTQIGILVRRWRFRQHPTVPLHFRFHNQVHYHKIDAKFLRPQETDS